MAVCLLILLIAISTAMIAWGLSARDRIYQYPTLAGVAWLGYIVPQAIGVYNNPFSVPGRALYDGGLELALAMSSLCAGCSFVGYLWGGPVGNAPVVQPAPSTLSSHRLFVFGLLLYLVAMVAFYKLDELCGGGFRYFSTGGAYTLHWRGRPVIYAFFVKLIYPGLLLCLVAALRTRSLIHWLAVGVGCMLPLANTIFLGRRQNTVILLLIFAVSIFFVRRWTPPRSVSLCAMVLGALMIVLAPAYRAHSQFGSDHGRLLEMDVRGRLEDKIQGRRTWVFENAVVQMAAVQRASQFGRGLGTYNRTIQLLVPRAVVGDELKEALLYPTADHRDLTWNYYRWVTKYGTYSTGPCDAFREFWFLGAIIFLVIARVFRWLWHRASQLGDQTAQLFYAATCVIAMNSIVNNIGGIPAQVAISVAILLPVTLLSRVVLPDDTALPAWDAPVEAAAWR